MKFGGLVYEIVAESPAGSLFLLNRSGLAERRIADLERQLADARSTLAALELAVVTEAVAAGASPTRAGDHDSNEFIG